MNQSLFIGFLCTVVLFSCKPKTETPVETTTVAENTDTLRYEEEKHLANIRQLTFGGDNAEAYWSFDGNKLTFQATRKEWNASCDQIFMMDTRDKTDTTVIPQRISPGAGRTTCSYFTG